MIWSSGTRTFFVTAGRAGLITLLGFAAFGTAGCGTLQGGNQNLVSKDVLEIKHLVERQKDESASSGRKVEYRLDSLDEKVQAQSGQIKASVTDLEKTVRAQGEQIEKLRKAVDELGYQVASIGGRAGMQSSGASSASSQAPEGGAPAPAAGDSQAAYLEALKQYNLGHYAPARKGFEQVLAGNPEGEAGVQARYWLAESCYALNDFVAATDGYTKLITTNPSHTLAWQSLERLGQISQKQGRIADALRMYEQIITKNPSYDGIERVKAQVQALKAAKPTN